jgi:hypothetical protein
MAYIQRTSQDTILRSEKLPAVSIRIDPAFKYVGATSFILYDIARAEQHHFVVADAERRVEKLLWFQFEGYLADNDRRYRYPSSMKTITLNGLAFLHDGDVLNIDQDYRERPTSDSAHVVDFLKGQGYTLEGDTMFRRLVWLDAGLRNELMIIYSEDLRPTGFRAADLAEGGANADQWSALARALQRRALGSFSVE